MVRVPPYPSPEEGTRLLFLGLKPRAFRRGLVKIDAFVEITISSRKTSKQRRIEEVLEMLADMDTLVVTELSRLGCTNSEADRDSLQTAQSREYTHHRF